MKTALIISAITLLTLSSLYLFNQQSAEQFNIENLKAFTSNYCPDPAYRDNESFQNFMNEMKSLNFSTEKLDFIKTEVPKDPRFFSKDQILTLIKESNFTTLKVEAMQFLEPYITFFTAQEIVDIVNAINFSSEKMTVLKVVAPLLNEATDDNKEFIVNKCFSFSSDKTDARNILKDIASRDCIFGTVTEKVATFIIDVSGSMDYNFKTQDGVSISRLTYVKEHLKQTISDQLKEYQLFNIIYFSSTVGSWQTDNVSATATNITSALKFIDNLKAGGATNISAALDKAFQSKQQLEGIYLLSDGAPNGGVQSVSAMGDYIDRLVSSRNPRVRINTISFMLGGSESASERKSAQAFLNIIAERSQGSFKQME